jgi:hypothetical protein
MHRRKTVRVEIRPANPAQQYFRVAEAASYLRVTISAIRLAYTSEKLVGKIVGKRLVFKREDLDSFFAAVAQ